jgi:Carbohydrate kinase
MPGTSASGGVPGLGTAGSGDVLAGLLAGVVACGVPPIAACLWSVYLHAQAGVDLATRVGRLSALFPGLLDTLSAGARSTRADAAMTTMTQSPPARLIEWSHMLEALPVLNSGVERLQRHHAGIDRRICSETRVRDISGWVEVPEIRMLVRDVSRVEG